MVAFALVLFLARLTPPSVASVRSVGVEQRLTSVHVSSLFKQPKRVRLNLVMLWMAYDAVVEQPVRRVVKEASVAFAHISL